MISIDIRQVDKISDTDQIEEIQRDAWNMEEVEILPGRFLHALQANGACLYGAFDGDKLVGFVFGILGTVEDLEHRKDQVAAARLQMYSAIMGVSKAYQGLGIGYRLKLAQREFALRIGVRLITWTYDPLESKNAHLNFSKLGVICHKYYRNFHGELGGINAGLPTDRFYVEWWITSNRVNGKISKKRPPLGVNAYRDGGAVLVNPVDANINEMPIPPEDFIQSTGKLLMIQIPAHLQRIKREEMFLAQRWRLHTREIFEYYFEHNYMVTDLVADKSNDHISTCYYVLSSADS